MYKITQKFVVCAMSGIACAWLPPVYAHYSCAAPAEYFFTPYDDGLSPYLALLDKAKQTVHIAIYGFTEPAITEKLIELHRRGVQVNLIVDRSQSRGKAQLMQIRKLQLAGVDVCIGTSAVHGQIMHNKLTIVDDRYVEVGSWNYTRSATRQSNVLMILDSPALAERFMDNWQRIKDDILRK